MNSYSSRVQQQGPKVSTLNRAGYISNPVSAPIVTGDFYQAKPLTMRDMIIRRINKTLCCFLFITIFVAFISYYIAMNYEAKLNALDSEIVKLNTENQDLQAELDRYKSFNNVDIKLGQYKLLQKAEKVIEVTAMNTDDEKPSHTVSKSAPDNLNWAIGY